MNQTTLHILNEMCELTFLSKLFEYSYNKFQAKRLTKFDTAVKSVHCLQKIPQCTLNVVTAGKCQFTSTMLRDN